MTTDPLAGISVDLSNDCLVVIFREKLALSLLGWLPDKEFVLMGDKYCDLGHGAWTGFYDWLRNPDDAVIGVRYWPDAGASYLLRILSQVPYVERDSGGNYCEIYFGQRRDAESKRSKDQELIYDKAFLSSEGVYAVAFELSCITTPQLIRLCREAEADWLTSV